MMDISPSNRAHQALEKDVEQALSALGFLIASATYHSVLPSEVKDRLQNTYTSTALYLRGRADRIAIHKELPLVFEWEAKTHSSTLWHDMTIEALPLCHHLAEAQLGVRCLYAYRNPYKKHNVGFWISDMPPIREIKIPIRWTEATQEWFAQQFRRFMPQVPISILENCRGSRDPFVIIDQSEIEKMPHWNMLILTIWHDMITNK